MFNSLGSVWGLKDQPAGLVKAINLRLVRGLVKVAQPPLQHGACLSNLSIPILSVFEKLVSTSDNYTVLGGVAHRLEQAAHNRLVVGSIPTTPTKLLQHYKRENFVA
jgi:hypothetical protein